MRRVRRCDECGTVLRGRKGHGFVSEDGRRVTCAGQAIKHDGWPRGGCLIPWPSVRKRDGSSRSVPVDK